MADIDGLIKRLEAIDQSDDHDLYINAPILTEAAAALRALRDALEWLADAVEDGDEHGADHHDDDCTICCGIEKARALLGDGK